MKETIELDKNIGYTYSSKHKSLIYKANPDQNLVNNNPAKYQEELLKLYNTPSYEREVKFTEYCTQIIEKSVSVTTQVIFEVTEKCNLSCTYCGYGDTYIQTSGKRCHHMDWKTAKTILDFYIRAWKKERPKKFRKFCYIGFYGGEPLLNMPLVKKIVNYLEEHSKDLNFRYSMTTNGTLLHKHIEYLIEKDFVLTVSLDGDREMNSFRVYNNGTSIYDDLFDNLKEIQVKNPDYFKESIEFISVANSRNTDNGIISFFNKEFGKSPRIHQLLSSKIGNYEHWELIRRKEIEEKKDKDQEKENSKLQLSNYIKLFSGNFYEDYKSLLDNSATIVKTPTGTCFPFADRVFITAKKNLIACEKVGFEHTIGKVTNDGVNIDFESVAAFYNKISNKFKAQCEKCYISNSCKVCFLTNEEYFKENFKCESFYPVSELKKCITESIKTLREETIDFNELISDMV